MEGKERKEEILRLIQSGVNNVKSLAKHFGVSLMTIYRDVRELEKEGRIVRRHGELRIRSEEDLPQELRESCAFCGKMVDRRLSFLYMTAKGRKIKACCAHCGLLLYNSIKDDEITSCLTSDFITGNPLSCFSAYYVVGTSAMPCCAPSVIAFAKREDAQKFAKGFDGAVLNFEDAVKMTQELMKRGAPVRFSL